jgi:FtsH-binding integral membrane protein
LIDKLKEKSPALIFNYSEVSPSLRFSGELLPRNTLLIFPNIEERFFLLSAPLIGVVGVESAPVEKRALSTGVTGALFALASEVDGVSNVSILVVALETSAATVSVVAVAVVAVSAVVIVSSSEAGGETTTFAMGASSR